MEKLQHTLLILTMITTETPIDPCRAADDSKTQAHRTECSEGVSVLYNKLCFQKPILET